MLDLKVSHSMKSRAENDLKYMFNQWTLFVGIKP